MTTPQSTATDEGAQQAAKASLCVEVARTHSAVERGTPVQWVVEAWITAGNIPDAVVHLKASPASVTPRFSFGCGSSDGTASCDLGAMDAKSARRELQAEVTVPVTASKVTSVALTVTGRAAHLVKAPAASAKVTITKPVTPAATKTAQPSTTPTPAPTVTTTPLAVGSLPSLTNGNPRLSPGGNAAGLFPTLAPLRRSGKKADTRAILDTAALPGGVPIVGAQIAGLAALALALALAVTRLSVRRPAPALVTPPDQTAPLQPIQPTGTARQPGQSDAADGQIADADEASDSESDPSDGS